MNQSNWKQLCQVRRIIRAYVRRFNQINDELGEAPSNSDRETELLAEYDSLHDHLKEYGFDQICRALDMSIK